MFGITVGGKPPLYCKEAIPMPTQQLCTVASMTRLDDATFWMVLEAGDLVRKFGPCIGQFVHIKCGDGQFLRRPISVALASCGEPQDLIALIFEVRGEGTQWLSRRQAGDKVDVLGPLGNGFSLEEQGRYLLVGGGIGVPPLLNCAALLQKRSVAVAGYRSAAKVFPAVLDRFRSVCQDTYLCTDDGSLGRYGFTDSAVRDILEQDRDFTSILACGPAPMLRNVARVAAQFGVPCQVSMEERMACGVGACLGCAIKMKDGSMRHVCKDGPVFFAEEVDWNV